MNRNILSRAAVVGVATGVVVGYGMAPAMAADGDGSVAVTNTETVQVLMDSNAGVKSSRVYEQIDLFGKGNVNLKNPIETKGLRNLDGFKGFDVKNGQQFVKAQVDGEKRFRTVSSYKKDLPVKITVRYFLNGQPVEAGDVVGKSGKLGVFYKVENRTGTPQTLTYSDADGNEVEKEENVAIPMVGSMTVVAPSNFTDVVSKQANMAGDGRGGTQMSFTMTLFPPIGSNVSEFGYEAQVEDAVVPAANMSLLPVNPLESPSFSGGAASYKGGAETGAKLTAGATTIDENLLKLRDGANDLIAGLLQLKDGAGKLSAGLKNDAAPGAGKLAAGAGKLDAGAGKLNAGAGELSAGGTKLARGADDLNGGSAKLRKGAGDLADGTGKLDDGATKIKGGADQLYAGTGALDAGAKKAKDGAAQIAGGLKSASAKAPELLAGLDQIAAGLGSLDAGLQQLNGQVAGGTQQLNGGLNQVINGIKQKLQPGLAKIDGGLTAARAANEGNTNPASKATVEGTLAQVQQGVKDAQAGVSNEILPGLGQVNQGVTDLRDGVAAGVGTDDPSTNTLRGGVAKLEIGTGTIKSGGETLVKGLGDLGAGADSLDVGLAALVDGVAQLMGGAQALSVGSGDLAAGASAANVGANKLSDGTVALNEGTKKLAPGANALADGAGKLAAGTGTLKAGTGELSAGAAKLAAGLNTAADGSGQIFEGLVKASDAAPAIPEGAQQLSDEGTKKLILAGQTTGNDYGTKYALIEAGAERAQTASMAYGAPAGADGLTAYKFELAGNDGEGSRTTTRGLAALALFAGGGALAFFRRRSLLGM